ncbi:hypothetical protein BX661DRAFT_185093 [Kickxella alabastrina]|uniref:uncharacterized protein n=1 Tax=Kickxella alabastrina TaxID=61397 RepID=UPI00221E7AEE|nr:uncharacterized protein BX661DRAFT_185093 [Kickxella alabastrina]KAI7825008.1 hypothetical protein BX661DRAFT_185093 [Kickxella alabastrina]KAJ1941039.1 hypothetical protein GGF37_003726 [Kickxella alabastrina]
MGDQERESIEEKHPPQASIDPSDTESDTEDEGLFVAEDEYAPLQEDSESENQDDIADTIETHSHMSVHIPSLNRIPLDLECALDKRMEDELARQKSPTTTPIDAPPGVTADTAVVGDSDARSKPLEIKVAEPMSAEHIDHIKRVMAGIQICPDAVPEWARRVPESAWIPKRSESSSEL